MRIVRGTAKFIRRVILIAVIIIILLIAFIIYPKTINFDWNHRINELVNPPDFECEFDSDCVPTHVGCGCGGYGACVAKGHKNFCPLPMPKGILCEMMLMPKECFCIDSKCMTI